MSDEQDSDRGKDFKLERYKYILQQIHTLNENYQKYLNLFQTLATTIVGGGVAVFVSWRNLKISPEIARTSIRALIGLLVILALFLVANIIIGIFSWFDYRRDEVKLLDEVVGKNYRNLPRYGNLWRWHETYLVIFLILVIISIFVFVETQVIPLIK